MNTSKKLSGKIKNFFEMIEMKKLVAAFLINFFVLSNVCCANSYDNDPDYYFFMSVQCWKHYLNLKSIDVQEYNPPYYKISAKIVSVGYRQNEGRSGEYTETIRYNWQIKEAFEYRNGKWRKLCQGLSSSTPYAVDKLTANALFLAAYGMKFYE